MSYFRSIILVVGLIFAPIIANSADLNIIDPQPLNLWYTSLPPIDPANVETTTLYPLDGSIVKVKQTVYFNFYGDFVSGGTNKWYVIRDGIKVECDEAIPSGTCATSPIKVLGDSADICIDFDMQGISGINLHELSNPVYTLAGTVVVHNLQTNLCSDATCIGIATRSDRGPAALAPTNSTFWWSGATGGGPTSCRSSFVDSNETEGWPYAGYFYFQLGNNTGTAGTATPFPDPSLLLRDVTITIRATSNISRDQL